MRRILWWARRDLRLDDNIVLHHARNDGAAVIPVFVLDPKLLNSDKLAPSRRQFLFEALQELDVNLQGRGSYLVIRKGDAASELVKLARETVADAVYFHADYTPYARRRDARVTAALEEAGIRHASFNELYLADPNQVVKEDGSPYTVYSRYRARFEAVVAVPERYSTNKNLNTPPGIPSLALPRAKHSENHARGGEREGMALALEFVARRDGLREYGEMRNDMAADATSHLSPHLHFGTVSARELVRMARETFPGMERQNKTAGGTGRNGAQNAKIWIDELVWREFLAHVLYHYPHAARQAFRADYADLPWENDGRLLSAWQRGETGYPIVDAGMRQLNASGWMHNRTRMITASFLTKDLLMDWRKGERYFLQNLMDGDVASNNGGWQWVAGTGTDAQPYFRIFNPILQGARFDPAGEYVRRWVPELAKVPAEFIHAPWEMPDDMARGIGLRLGKVYPKPIVDHAVQRERALALYRSGARRKETAPVGEKHQAQVEIT